MSPRKPPKPALKKVILEIRYKPDLGFYDRLMPAAQAFTDEYPHWQTSRLAVSLRDWDNRCSQAIRHNRFSYEQDSDNVELEKERIDLVLDRLPKALEVETALRFGYRRRYLVEVNMELGALVEVINTKLFSQDERLLKVLPRTVTDLMYRLDLKDDDGASYHLTLGPVQGAEAANYVVFNREQHLDPDTAQGDYADLVAAYPSVALFIDIDYYRFDEDIPLSEAKTFVEKARETTHKLAVDLTQVVLSTQVDG
ncbi:MAG: hypothetical protein WBP34_02665 [Thermoanaerobaculia bacterium]